MALVYSTRDGRLCPDCEQPVDRCVCRETKRKAVPAGDGIVRVSRETKGRKGKGVTLVTGLPLAADEIKELGKKLKQRCGSGGTVKDGVVEIQGDHRQAVMEALKQQGFTVKLAGG